MRDCTCGAPEDAEPEDHDEDCPENPGSEDVCCEECGCSLNEVDPDCLCPDPNCRAFCAPAAQ